MSPPPLTRVLSPTRSPLIDPPPPLKINIHPERWKTSEREREREIETKRNRMEQQKEKDEASQPSQVRQDSRESTSKLNPTAVRVLREAVISQGEGEREGEGEGERGEKGESKEGSSADEVLAYSRAVHHVDSSLE